MITREQLDADKAAVDAAQAKLQQDQAEFDRVQPHMSVLADMEQMIGALPEEFKAGMLSLVARARELL